MDGFMGRLPMVDPIPLFLYFRYLLINMKIGTSIGGIFMVIF